MKLKQLLQLLLAVYVTAATVSAWLARRYTGGTAAPALVVCAFVAGAGLWLKRFGAPAIGWGRSESFPHLLVDRATVPPGSTVMRFVCVSDTHCRHSRMVVPDGDVLLHAGDLTMGGSVKELKQFHEWISALPHKHKIVIAGNHDLVLDGEGKGKKFDKFGAAGEGRRERAAAAKALLTGCTYVQDGTAVVVNGIKIFGTPSQPPFHAMAFNHPSAQRKAVFDAIPAGTDIVLTHSPARGWRDRVVLGWRVGDAELARAIERVRPRFHVFGHIHESRGVAHNPKTGTTHINAANCTLLYRATQPPIVFDFVSQPPAGDAAAASAAAAAK